MHSKQVEISEKFRAILIDWLVNVHLKFTLLPETLYLTVNLIDRFLAKETLKKDQFQLLGVSAMLIAAKYEEIYAPEVRDFVYVSDKLITKEEILKMEYKILTVLNFDILHTSSYKFLMRYHFLLEGDEKLLFLSQFITEVALLEYKMLGYSASMMAASALNVAGKLLKKEEAWPIRMSIHSGYKDKDMANCCKDLVKILELVPRINLKNSIKKFSRPEYREVALLCLNKKEI